MVLAQYFDNSSLFLIIVLSLKLKKKKNPLGRLQPHKHDQTFPKVLPHLKYQSHFHVLWFATGLKPGFLSPPEALVPGTSLQLGPCGHGMPAD